ncbi:MAG: zinc ribbon domain-containing protein [Deltaproteobacteria bacterium]|nr:MAG: zinc ribbon domain-containing protein [Deltaproteobacteria bacterium]
MPTYEYECQNTGRRFDFFQNMNDEPLQKCPECGGPVRKLISAGGGIIFKGSGFYATDYKGGGGGASPPACGSDKTCCGRDFSCDYPPCGS